MVDTKSPGDKTLSVPTKTLTLKPRVETGTVRQSFSHGRTKQVVVEKRGKRRVGADAPAAAARAALPAARAPGVAADITDEDEGPRQIRRGPGGVARPATAPKTTAKPAPQKQRGRLTLVTALNADDVRERSIASFRRRTQRLKGHQSNEPKEKLVREVIIPEAINIQELANRMSERAVDVIRLLMKQGAMHKITDVIDADTAQLIAEELGHTVKRVAAADVEEGL